MTEYEVKPKDVFVIRAGGRGGRAPQPPEPGLAGWLRRNRFKLALAIIVIEGVLAAVYDISPFLLLVFAVAFVGLYIVYRTRLTNPTIRNAAFILAFSQAVVAVIPLFITVTVFAIVIVAAVAVVIMVMLLLGERSRR
jgi:heme A synthase